MRRSLPALLLLFTACNSSESLSAADADTGSGAVEDTGSGAVEDTGSGAVEDTGSGAEADTTDTTLEDTGSTNCELAEPPASGAACDCVGDTQEFLSTPTGPVSCTCLDTGWACASIEPDPDTSVDDTSADTGVDDTTVEDTTADTTVEDTTADTAADTTPRGLCEAGGGVCIGSGGACETVGGTRYPAGDSQCLFSDGPGACCVPPPVQPTGDTCADRGGVCAPIAGCNFTNSAFAPTPTPSCGFGGFICCVPNTVCGEETMVCCNSMTTFRPACDRGQWICTIEGTTMRPPSECP